MYHTFRARRLDHYLPIDVFKPKPGASGYFILKYRNVNLGEAGCAVYCEHSATVASTPGAVFGGMVEDSAILRTYDGSQIGGADFRQVIEEARKVKGLLEQVAQHAAINVLEQSICM